jgi:hypothetical protein
MSLVRPSLVRVHEAVPVASRRFPAVAVRVVPAVRLFREAEARVAAAARRRAAGAEPVARAEPAAQAGRAVPEAQAAARVVLAVEPVAPVELAAPESSDVLRPSQANT